jgi:hypothetical protein
MKLPNGVKIAWWLLLTGLLTVFLYHRYPDLAAGHATPADIVVFVIWIALLLAPIFSEVSLLGITLKQEIQELKGFVSAQVADIRSDVRNAVDIRTTVSPHFYLPAPVADAALPGLKANIESAVAEALAAHGVSKGVPPAVLVAPDSATLLFAARYNIELALRRIAEVRQLPAFTMRAVPIYILTRQLTEAGLIERRLADAIREVYAVCNSAVHGEPVTASQISFVEEVAPGLVAALRTIQ